MKRISTLLSLLVLTTGLCTGLMAQDDYSTTLTTTQNQAILTLKDGTKKYYNTASVNSIEFSGANVTVNQQQGSYTFQGNVQAIGFSKAAVPVTGQVKLLEATGWLESAYVTFEKVTGAAAYLLYVKGGQYADYTMMDQQLVRDYGDYARADAVGLTPAADYRLRIVPVDSQGNEVTASAAETDGLEVRSYSRQGFAFMNGYSPGAYNADGTLKTNAKVYYVTKNTAKTIKTTVVTSDKGATTECTGIQTIIDAYQKGYDTTPLAFRFIGLVTKDDLDGISSSEEGLQIKGKKADSELNITIEGIGDDATIKGFGFLVRNAKGVEFRNLGIMRCMDDGISLDTDNSNIWVHHTDVFYGPNGSGDHAKGDGAVDVKSDSKYVTVSYNRFWDTGKTNMFGMKSESGPNYISYDHNWFDHSDSRHPRVRTMSVHVWNNYFDNVAKYGVGATTGASVFVENNYFLKTKKPILSSQQGTDAKGSGTFLGEEGGMIKAYGNYFDRTTKNFSYYTQNSPYSTGYDAYETATRDEQVPATEVTKAGGTAYNNFDTNSSLMYSYDAVSAGEVPALLTGNYGAGRMNHGDFTYTFPDNVGSDDDDSVYDATLGGLLDNYQSSLVAVYGEESTTTGGGDNPDGGDNPGGGNVTPTPEGTITCSFNKSGTPSNTFFTVNGNGSGSKGTATVDGTTYSTCLKMESSTSVKFTLTERRKMTLYFGSTETASIKINGTKITGSGSTYSQELEAGSYELTKDKSVNLFFIKLEPVQ